MYDSNRRLADHFGGKLHIGYLQIRERLKELKEKFPPGSNRGGSYSRGGGGGGRDRYIDRDRDRDRRGYSPERYRSRDRDSRRRDDRDRGRERGYDRDRYDRSPPRRR